MTTPNPDALRAAAVNRLAAMLAVYQRLSEEMATLSLAIVEFDAARKQRRPSSDDPAFAIFLSKLGAR